MSASDQSLTDAPQALTPSPQVRSRWAWGLVALGVAVLALLAIALALPAQLAGWLLIGGGGAALVCRRPALGVYALPFAVAFGSLVSLAGHGVNIGPTDLLVAALVLAWAARDLPLWRNRFALVKSSHPPTAPSHEETRLGSVDSLRAWVRAAWRRDALGAAVFLTLLAYLGAILLSFAVAISLVPALKEALKWSEALVTLALALRFVRTARQVQIAVWLVIAAGVAQALLGLGQWALASGAAGPGGESLRVFGTFGQPNPYAGYLNFALPVALALAALGHDARERWLAGGAAALLLGAAALANSRGGELGLAAALVTLVVVSLRRERLAVVASVIGAPLLLVAWGTDVIPLRLQTALLRAARLDGVSPNGQVTSANFSTMERLAHWIAGLRMFAAHPLLGVGAGNYDAAYARYALDPQTWPEALGHAHNYYINVAAETGVIGLVTFLAFTGAQLAAGYSAARLARDHRDERDRRDHAPDAGGVPLRALAVGLFAALVALMVHNLTDNLFVHAMELEVALLAAMLLRIRALARASVPA